MKKTGIYIHIPFCKSKCPYCDFYSLRCDDSEKSRFIQSLKKEICSAKSVCADTIYIGGGTPSVLTGEELSDIVDCAKKQFSFTDGEITVEANPSSLTSDFAEKSVKAGVNRFSLGVQSVIETERKILGRRSSAGDIGDKINLLKEFGANNISLDVMLGVPNQTISSLEQTLEYCVGRDIQHISAYILKIEDGTYFDKQRSKYDFPNEELTSQMYEFTCDFLKENGFVQYEISNFSKPGFESRHNLKYWNCEEYLGFGPSAHSFFNSKRFFHENYLERYINDPFSTVEDGDGGGFEEYAMLKLRLTKGLDEKEVFSDFGFSIPHSMRQNAEMFIKDGFVVSDENGIRLTSKGFLVSNYIISHIL